MTNPEQESLRDRLTTLKDKREWSLAELGEALGYDKHPAQRANDLIKGRDRINGRMVKIIESLERDAPPRTDLEGKDE